jgi:ABC-type sugar transport system ATPase subunit
MATVQLDNVTKRFDATTALEDISFAIPSGSLMTIVGPSGCGKSTLLRLICGLERAESGRILIGDVDVTERPPKERGCAMVFQSYALYPHWTVRQNIGFPLRVRHKSSHAISEHVEQIARDLNLTSKLDQRPRTLSGGERQRVALGRAMAADPQVFLFDEPLSNLDAPLRAGMRAEIVSRQRRLGRTALYVTHDQIEALTMGDRVLVLDQGRMMGMGKPEDLYRDPPNRFVAAFLGRPAINLVRGGIVHGSTGATFEPLNSSVASGTLPSSVDTSDVEVGIRPEHLRLAAPDESSRWRVSTREFVGERTEYRITNGPLTLSASGESDTQLAVNSRVSLHVNPELVLFFDPRTGHRLR